MTNKKRKNTVPMSPPKSSSPDPLFDKLIDVEKGLQLSIHSLKDDLLAKMAALSKENLELKERVAELEKKLAVGGGGGGGGGGGVPSWGGGGGGQGGDFYAGAVAAGRWTSARSGRRRG